MKRAAAWIAGAALLMGGCAPGPAKAPPATPASLVQWLPGPTPDVRSLVLPPAPVGVLDADDAETMALAVGAFLSEMRTDRGPRHHLALLLQLEGEDPVLSIDLTRGVVVEMDGAVYVGDPGASGDGLHVHASPRGRVLSVAVPVAVEDLERIIEAETVRVRLGGGEAVSLAPAARDRLRQLVERLPVTASRTSRRFLAVQSTDG